MMASEIIAILGVIGITLLLVKVFHFIFRMKLVYTASDISRELQGLERLPKPNLKNLVALVNFLITKKGDIEKQLDDIDDDDKYRNTYG